MRFLLLVTALLSCIFHVQAKAVFAHFMVTIPHLGMEVVEADILT